MGWLTDLYNQARGIRDIVEPDEDEDEGGEEGDGSGDDSGGGESGDDSSETPSLSARSISVPSIVSDYTDEELNKEYHVKQEYMAAVDKFGAIYKTITFSDVSSVAKLKEYAKEWIRRNYYDGVLSFNVKAVDLHLLGYDKDKILCGDRTPVEFLESFYADRPPRSAEEFKKPIKVVRSLTCVSAQYDLLKPENSSYKIGVPDLAANVKYRESVNQTSSTKSTNKTTETSVVQQVMADIVKAYIDIGTPETVPDDE